MSLWAVLLTGLFAGGASCAAVQGGLLAGTLARRTVSVGGRRPPTASTARREDVVPVAGFLVGKLASHSLLGFALGLLGDVVQPSPRIRAAMQIIAGVVMVLLALDLLGVRALRNIVPTPPSSWARLVRRSGRLGHGFGPAALGAATVLIPCGVTLSVMFLSVASGSPLAGAAIMATFVVGTMPLFAAIGYVARRTSGVLRGRLSVLSGVVVLLAGLLAINAGLVLSGSSVSLTALRERSANARPARSEAAPALEADGVQRLLIEARSTSYSPAVVTAKAGVTTELTIRTNNTQGCTRAIVMPSLGVEKVLPATGDTTFDLGVLEVGNHRYTCGMGMYTGMIRVVS